MFIFSTDVRERGCQCYIVIQICSTSMGNLDGKISFQTVICETRMYFMNHAEALV